MCTAPIWRNVHNYRPSTLVSSHSLSTVKQMISFTETTTLHVNYNTFPSYVVAFTILAPSIY